MMSQAPLQNPLIAVRHLHTTFPVGAGLFRQRRVIEAVADVTLDIERGETLAIVGESGSGKTTLGRSILRLVEPTSGDIIFDGIDVRAQSPASLRALRKRMQIIFQDPFSSLNPRMRVGETVKEGMLIHGLARGSDATRRVRELFEEVGLSPDLISRYPHQFSGGQRQRIGIARALSVDPDFIVCDEAVSALDVSIQAQILELLGRLQQERGITFLFISHDLGVVQRIAHRVAVMHQGRIVEMGPAREVYSNPKMPYTKALLSAVPISHPSQRETARQQRKSLQIQHISPMGPGTDAGPASMTP